MLYVGWLAGWLADQGEHHLLRLAHALDEAQAGAQAGAGDRVHKRTRPVFFADVLQPRSKLREDFHPGATAAGEEQEGEGEGAAALRPPTQL